MFHNVCTGNGVGLFYFRGGCIGNVVQNNIWASNRTDCSYDNGGERYGDPARNRDDYNCYHPGRPDLGAEILDHFLLLAVDPTCEDDDVQLPGVEEEIHDRPVGVK